MDPDAGKHRLAVLTAAAAAHAGVAADARITRDDAFLAEYDAGRSIPQIAADAGAASSTVHRGILRASARAEKAAGDDTQ